MCFLKSCVVQTEAVGITFTNVYVPPEFCFPPWTCRYRMSGGQVCVLTGNCVWIGTSGTFCVFVRVYVCVCVCVCVCLCVPLHMWQQHTKCSVWSVNTRLGSVTLSSVKPRLSEIILSMQGVKMSTKHLKSLRYDRQHVFMLIVIAACLQ